MSPLSAWMSWEGGVDLVASTGPDMDQPNVIVHVGRLTHTPSGSSPAGMILYAPHGMPPLAMGFIAGDPKVGAYFGPNIFAGTPFENAPHHAAVIDVTTGEDWCAAHIQMEGLVIETRLEKLGPLELVHREATDLPFVQTAIEAAAASATLRINGEDIALHLPPKGLAGGAPAVWSPTGMYTR